MIRRWPGRVIIEVKFYDMTQTGVRRFQMGRVRARWARALVIGGAAVAMPVIAQSPAPQMLTELERGRWQLTERGAESPPRAVCLGNTQELIQIRHPGARCRSFIVNDTAETVTVGYDCQAGGNGNTVIRRETNRLVQIETQGVANGAPFAQTFEARRIGAC